MPQLRLYAAKLIKINVKKKKEVHSFGFLKKKKKKVVPLQGDSRICPQLLKINQ